MSSRWQRKFMQRPKFILGRIIATPRALEMLLELGVLPHDLLRRHQNGDWGDLCDEDKQANEAALVEGSRLLSAYCFLERKIWVITEADRASTCILLPSEY